MSKNLTATIALAAYAALAFGFGYVIKPFGTAFIEGFIWGITTSTGG